MYERTVEPDSVVEFSQTDVAVALTRDPGRERKRFQVSEQHPYQLGDLKRVLEKLPQESFDWSHEERAEVLRLAQQRHHEMKRLIQENPEQALKRAFSPSLIHSLPDEVQVHMEQHVSGMGFFGVGILCNHSNEERLSPSHAHHEHEIVFNVVMEEPFQELIEYRAHPYGERLRAKQTEEHTSLYGVAIGEDLALADGEIYLAQQQDESWLLAAEGIIRTYSDETQARAEEQLAHLRIAAMNPEAGEIFDPIAPPAGEDPPWDIPYDRYTGTNSHQKGVKTLLMIYANGADYLTTGEDVTPFRKTEAELREETEDASRYFYDVSYRQTWFGKKTWTGTPGPNGEDYVPMVHAPPTVVLPNEASFYKSNTFGTTRSHLISAVRALGGEYAAGGRLDPNNFDRITFYMRGTAFGNGLAYVGSNFMWATHHIRQTSALHEFGHNWGVVHANAWIASQPIDRDTYYPGVARHPDNTHSEYGGAGDMMGGAGPPFSVMFKQKLGFLEKTNAQGLEEVKDVTTSGTYRLFDHTDVDARNATSALRGLWIPINGFTSSSKHLLLGFRHYPEQPGSANEFYRDWGYNSVEVLSDGTSASSGENDGSHYIDTSPFSYHQIRGPVGKGDDRDGAIPLGRTYSEAANLNGNQIYGGFHITPVGRGQATDDAGTPGDTSDDTTHEWIDVKVVYNSEVSHNTVPEITSLTASTTHPGIGQNVTFTVSATDADHDTLYYWWKFHQLDASQDNQPQQMRSWSTAGQYYVTVHVSDGKGGVAVKGMQIDVGSPVNVYGIQGRVLRGGKPVAGAKLWISDPKPPAEGDIWHDAFSESDGTYRFKNLPPGTYTIRAAHPIYLEEMSPMDHSVTIGSSDQFGKDFTMQVASTSSYTVTGRVLYAGTGFQMNNQTLPLEGVSVSASGASATTDSSGNFTLENIPTGGHSLTVTHPKLKFDPVGFTVADANKDIGTIHALTHRVRYDVDHPSGSFSSTEGNNGYLVFEGLPVSQPGLFRALVGGEFALYEFVEVPASDNSTEPPVDVPYTIRAVIPGYTTTPSDFSNPVITYSDFDMGRRFSAVVDASSGGIIQGFVRTSQGVPLAGVTVTAGTNTDTTDDFGFYQIMTDSMGTFAVSASDFGKTFTPASTSVTVSSSSAIKSQDFAADSGIILPTVSTVASATHTGDGATVQLSVLGADADDGESGLTYTWAKATGSGHVVFGANGSNSAKNTTAEVKASGTYSFRVTVSDGAGNYVTSTTGNVTVNAQLAAIIVSPGFSEIGLNTDQQFTAQGFDQFGDLVTVNPSWSVSSGGSISSGGLLSATTLSVDNLVTATSGSITGTGIFNVIAAKPVVSTTNTVKMGFNPGTYTLTAEASDPDGTVAKVEFYLNGSKVGEDTTAPYSYDLVDHPTGQYDYHVVATDNEGNTTATETWRFWLSTPFDRIVKINFERIAFTTPSGFLADKGAPLGHRTNGYHYGWSRTNIQSKDPDTDLAMIEWSGGYAPEEASAFLNWVNAVTPWHIRVPNGRYTVQVRVGDPTLGTDVGVERQIEDVAVSGSVGAVGNEFITLSRVVDVTDNQITMTDYLTGSNSSRSRVGASYVVIIPDDPVMSVTAGEAGTELSEDPLEFTVTRSANESVAFAMNFNLGGDASTSDYVVSGATTYSVGSATGTVAFAAGETSKVISLVPVQDTETEGTEHVTFTIGEDPDYVISTAEATGDILDAQTNYPPSAQLVWPLNGTSVAVTTSSSHWVEVGATDDGFGGSSLSYAWSRVSGPGTVSFADATAFATKVTVDVPGSYELRATVSDGIHEVTVDAHLEIGSSPVPANGLVTYYKMDETTGTTASDGSGNGNDAELSGTGQSWQIGQMNNAADFTNSGISYFRSGSTINISNSQGFTVGAWVRTDDIGSATRMIVQHEDGAETGRSLLAMTSTGSLFTFTGNGATEGGTLSPGQWHHVMITAGSGTVRLYLDGTQVGSQSRDVESNNARIRIGNHKASNAGVTRQWNGQIDEVVVYNRALNAAEVDAVYNTTPADTVPVVSAIADTTVAVNTALSLDGEVSDAQSIPTVMWRQLSGPGTASFADPSDQDTTVTFDEAGTYVIALVGDDGDMADGEVLTILATAAEPSPGVYDINDFNDWNANVAPEVTIDGTKTGFDEIANGMLQNGIIYALGINSLDPKDASGKLPVGQITQVGLDQHFEISFRRRTGGTGVVTETTGYTADGVVYVVECSSTLEPSSWKSGASLLEEVSTSDNGDGTETVVVRMKQTIREDLDGKEFLRVAVSPVE